MLLRVEGFITEDLLVLQFDAFRSLMIVPELTSECEFSPLSPPPIQEESGGPGDLQLSTWVICSVAQGRVSWQ